MQHQVRGSPQPVSCVTMFTPEGLTVSENERDLRGRALQVANTLREESAENAILEIMRTLRSEGGVEDLRFERDDVIGIGEELLPFLASKPQGVKEEIFLYHILMWKTAGDNAWTLRREPQAREVVPYLPALLEASALGMSAEICTRGEHLQPQERETSAEVEVFITDHQNWQEISVLEFLNASLPAEKVERAQGSASQPIVPVKTTKDRKLSWRCAQDSDNHNGETVFETDTAELYVRTNSDIRVLYENRPDRLSRMVLGEFLSQYRLLKPSDFGFERARNSINEATQVGPNSDQLIAGSPDTAAPETIMLKNGKIMKRRHNGIAVPNLLYFGSSSKHGNQLMWTPWRNLEEVTGAQEDEETDDQKRIRLEVFPLSHFPIEEGDSESEHE